MDITALLEEVDGLTAFIDPEFPFAHVAPRQAALAIATIETAAISFDVADENMIPLKILRAKTTTDVSLLTAIKLEDVDLVALILEANEANEANETIVNVNNRLGSLNTEILRLLLDLPLDRGIDPSVNYNFALSYACENGKFENVRLILDALLKRGGTYVAIAMACYNGHTEIVRLLLDLPLERGVHLRNGLKFASEQGHAEIVSMLLDLNRKVGSTSMPL